MPRLQTDVKDPVLLLGMWAALQIFAGTPWKSTSLSHQGLGKALFSEATICQGRIKLKALLQRGVGRGVYCHLQKIDPVVILLPFYILPDVL